MRVIRAADHRIMPWKNGQGSTTEIAVFPECAGLADFDWRVSMAAVSADGPFSSFPGIDRSLAVLTGAGIRLAIDGRPVETLTIASAPFAFPGDVGASTELIDGPITDFNVMSRRGRLTHAVRRLDLSEPVTWTCRASTVLAYSDAGALAIAIGDREVRLAAGESLVTDAAVGLWRFMPSSNSRLFWVEVFAA